VVVELLAFFAITAGVIDATSADGTLEPALRRLVHLDADHGLQILSPSLLVEVEDAVHVPVVGDADGRLPVGLGGGDDLLDAGRPVEHRKFGVEVEVRDRVAAAAAAGTSHRLDLLTGLSTGAVDRVTRV